MKEETGKKKEKRKKRETKRVTTWRTYSSESRKLIHILREERIYSCCIGVFVLLYGTKEMELARKRGVPSQRKNVGRFGISDSNRGREIGVPYRIFGFFCPNRGPTTINRENGPVGRGLREK